VSFETSFDSKQPKLEPKLVSALSETKRLFRLFRFYTETECFYVSIEPKQTEDQPKLFDREHILLFFLQKNRVFPFFFVFFVYLILYGCICLNMVRYDRVCDLICDRFSVVQRFSCSEFQRFQVFQGFQGFQVSKVSLAQCRVNVGQFESVLSRDTGRDGSY
jgi:hypothetical protein